MDHAESLPDRPTAAAPRVALIELLGRDGRVGRAVDVAAWPLLLGRAMDCDVVVDDPWVAAHHASIATDAQGRLMLQALPSRNGVQHGGGRLHSGETWVLPPGGAALTLGATRLLVRLPGEVLAPDRALPQPARLLAPVLMALALLALLLAGRWTALDPGADTMAWLPWAVGMPVAAIAWCGGWALASKLFQHRFDFLGHVRIALPWMLAVTLVDMGLPQLGAALAAPWLWYLAAPLQGLLQLLMVRAHLAHVLPQHPRLVFAGIATLAVATSATALATTYRGTQSFVAAPYMSTLPPPALRLAGTVPPEQLVQDLAPLAGRVAQLAQKARDDEDQAGADADEDGE